MHVNPVLFPSIRSQSFPEALLYNRETGLFEVASGEAECVSRRIETVLRRSKSQLLSGDHSVLSGTPPVDNRYTVWVRDESFFYVQSKKDEQTSVPWFLKECVSLTSAVSGQETRNSVDHGETTAAFPQERLLH